MTDTEHSQVIVARAKAAIGLLQGADLVFCPYDAAMALCIALGYLCAAFGLEPEQLCTVIAESADDVCAAASASNSDDLPS